MQKKKDRDLPTRHWRTSRDRERELVGVLRFGLATDKRKDEAGSVGSIYIDYMSVSAAFLVVCCNHSWQGFSFAVVKWPK